ncbi:MAG TPA: hypothetical protein VN048_07205 [Verrucomicrobiae bacterium]|nr:hypothetical protein [Verrucomicrobiae bacterium]
MELKGKDLALLNILQNDINLSRARVSGFQASLRLVEADPSSSQLKAKLSDRIQKEYANIRKLEQQVIECEGRVSAFDETIKMLEKGNSESDLRPDSQMDKVRKLIRDFGKPMALTDILKALGVEGNDSKRNSLRGSLSGYARDRRVFTKEEAPDTFGLLEFNQPNKTPAEKPPNP